MGARYFVTPPSQSFLKYIACLKKRFKEEQYQIVHSNMNTLSVFSLYAAWRAGVPVRINHNHSTAGKGETKRNIFKYILRPFAKCFATEYLACSQYAGEWLFGRKSMKNGQVKVFNNAIPTEDYKYNQEVRKQVRKKLGLEDKFVIGHVGRFCYQKNHEFLIDIFEDVHKREGNAVLLLVGIGELFAHIKEKVYEKGLDDVVMFLGARNDVNELYQAMDIFVLPSYYEGLPVVGVEAQSSGLPMICSNIIAQEVKATTCVQFLSLSDSLDIWSEKILSYKNFRRMDTSGEVRTAGFDIKLEAGKLESFYTEKLNL
jgi:glycosyltransferase EpsF